MVRSHPASNSHRRCAASGGICLAASTSGTASTASSSSATTVGGRWLMWPELWRARRGACPTTGGCVAPQFGHTPPASGSDRRSARRSLRRRISFRIQVDPPCCSKVRAPCGVRRFITIPVSVRAGGLLCARFRLAQGVRTRDCEGIVWSLALADRGPARLHHQFAAREG